MFYGKNIKRICVNKNVLSIILAHISEIYFFDDNITFYLIISGKIIIIYVYDEYVKSKICKYL